MNRKNLTSTNVVFVLAATENIAKVDSEATGYHWGEQEAKDIYEYKSKWDREHVVRRGQKMT